MKIEFDFGELLTISCALHTLDVVYGSNIARDAVMARVDATLDYMNSAPVTDIYPGLDNSGNNSLLDFNCSH